MSRNFVSTPRSHPLHCGLGMLAIASISMLGSSGKRVHLTPEYAPGTMLRYRIESTTTTTGKTTTPILNPEGGAQSNLTIRLVVRLNVLNAPAGAGSGTARLRATYEKSSAESESDAFDPAQPSISDQYARLEGKSIEFTITPNGDFVDVKGFDDVSRANFVTESAFSWLGQLLPGSGIPVDGVAIGEKWKTERPVEGAPLAGLVSRIESTYLHDEPCIPSAGAPDGAQSAEASTESCAVILSRFQISRAGSSRSDATPEDYRRNGLRVFGSWIGSGESLNYVSLSSGFLVRSTETTDQHMDYRITSAATGSSIHRHGEIRSQSEITLVPASSSS